MDGFTWTRHVDTGGYFRCPNDALDEMAKRGWLPCEPPEPPNPATAEHLAWRAEQVARKERDAGRKATTTTAAARGNSEEE